MEPTLQENHSSHRILWYVASLEGPVSFAKISTANACGTPAAVLTNRAPLWNVTNQNSSGNRSKQNSSRIGLSVGLPNIDVIVWLWKKHQIRMIFYPYWLHGDYAGCCLKVEKRITSRRSLQPTRFGACRSAVEFRSRNGVSLVLVEPLQKPNDGRVNQNTASKICLFCTLWSDLWWAKYLQNLPTKRFSNFIILGAHLLCSHA